MRILWKVLSLLLVPLRAVGYATDIHTLWTNRDAILVVTLSCLGAGLNAKTAFNREYPWYIVLLFVVTGLLFALWLTATGIEKYRRSQAQRQRKESSPAPSGAINYFENVYVGAQRQEEEERETAAKRKAVKELLGNALEEGLSLKQGRKYAVESKNQVLEAMEIGDEYQGRYDEKVRAWVNHTYDLIGDAFGKAEAQRFISNEGYSDEELFGRELPSFLHLSSTQRKHLIPARLKRLYELMDRMHDLDIDPDFDPDEWRNR